MDVRVGLYRKLEWWKIDAFELWCWRRLLRVPWAARRSNQSILKEISLEYSLEGLMLKLKLQYFGCLIQRTDSFEKTLMLGKIEGGRKRGWNGWMASLTQWTWVWVNSGSLVMDRESWRAAVHGVTKSQIRLSDLTELLWVPQPENRFLRFWGPKVKVLVAQSCPSLCDPMDYSLPGSSVPGILQARILEWVAIPFSRGSSWPRDWNWVPCIAVRFFTTEPPGKPSFEVLRKT